jgi:hypothetical protein
VEIFVRASDNDINNSGHPNLFAVTPWFPLVDAEQASDHRFVQARFNFTVPFSYAFATPLPFVDIFHVQIELK